MDSSRTETKRAATGGTDYIPKPFHGEEVLARVRTYLALYRLQSDLERLAEEGTVALRRSEDILKRATAIRDAV